MRPPRRPHWLPTPFQTDMEAGRERSFADTPQCPFSGWNASEETLARYQQPTLATKKLTIGLMTTTAQDVEIPNSAKDSITI